MLEELLDEIDLFQPTLPHGERRMVLTTALMSRSFNPRSRMGSDDYAELRCSGRQGVSTHAPAWGATQTMARSVSEIKFQPTLPHGERRQRTTDSPRVSIHVSTHAPAWGATRDKHFSVIANFCFNPRSRMGSDLKSLLDVNAGRVSTHAPAWGATERERAWREELKQFQPTLPHGERPALPCDFIKDRGFNPRSRMGSDCCGEELAADAGVSTHAPAWGATMVTPAQLATSRCFNPRSRMGSDGKLLLGSVVLFEVSTHAPAWGATNDSCATSSLHDKFQPTLPHGERHAWCLIFNLFILCFNPRSRMGSDTLSMVILLLILLSFNPRSRMGSDFKGLHTCGVCFCFNPRSRMGSDPVP